MLKIAHIINPAKIKKTSDLYLAQPVTFETMRIAKEFAKDNVNVDLFSAQFSELPCFYGPLPEEFPAWAHKS